MTDQTPKATAGWETQPCPACGRPRGISTDAPCAVRHVRPQINDMTRLILVMAPSFQGGHSKTGDDVAAFLGIPFPLRMSNLEMAARVRGFDPNDLWPWLAKMRSGTA